MSQTGTRQLELGDDFNDPAGGAARNEVVDLDDGESLARINKSQSSSK